MRTALQPSLSKEEAMQMHRTTPQVLFHYLRLLLFFFFLWEHGFCINMFVCFVPLQGTVSCRGRLWLAVRQLLFSSPLMAPRSTTSTNGCVNIYIFHNLMWWACPLEEIRFQWQCHVFILVFIETSLMLKLLWFNFCKLYTVWLNLLTDIIHENAIYPSINL